MGSENVSALECPKVYIIRSSLAFGFFLSWGFSLGCGDSQFHSFVSCGESFDKDVSEVYYYEAHDLPCVWSILTTMSSLSSSEMAALGLPRYRPVILLTNYKPATVDF